jgi:hypothetical protein
MSEISDVKDENIIGQVVAFAAICMFVCVFGLCGILVQTLVEEDHSITIVEDHHYIKFKGDKSSIHSKSCPHPAHK